MVSDSGYKRIADQVYNVEPKKAKSNKAQVIVKGSPVRDDVTGKKYQVLQVSDDPDGNGMQAMAVAPITGKDANGKDIVDTSQIVVAYAGTNAADIKDIETDLQTVVGGSSQSITLGNIQSGDFRVVKSQLQSAQAFFDDIKKKYPNAMYSFTGHSLGGYTALTIAMWNRLPATTFNGPDPVRNLSDADKKWVLKHKHLYNNFRVNYDGIGNFGAYLTKYFVTDELGISKNVYHSGFTINPLDLHSLNAYRFNKKGQLVDKHGKVIGSQYLASAMYASQVAARKLMVDFKTMKKRLKTSGGGLSGAEKIFLDAAQGYALGNSMALAARSGADEVSSLKDTADTEAEALWAGVNFGNYSALDYYEIEQLFASFGITREKMVDNFQDYTAKKYKSTDNLATDFETLRTNMEVTIQGIIESDAQLAKEFDGWLQ